MSSGSLPVRPGRARFQDKKTSKPRQHRSSRRMFFESLEERAMMAYAPGSVFRFGGGGSESYLHNLPLGGGMLGSPFTSFTGEARGQIAWSGNLTTAYTTNYQGGSAGEGTVLAIDSSGSVTTFATGLNGPTGILRTQDGRLLVSESSTGSIVDITAGGDASALPRFATGLSAPGNLVQRASGEILVLEVGSDEITALGSGGDLTNAVPFATFGAAANLVDIVESSAGGLFVSDSAGRAIYHVTSGGLQPTAAPFATGRAFGGLALDATGRLLAGGIGSDGRDVFDASAGGDLSAAAPHLYWLPTGTSALDSVPEPVGSFLTVTDGGDLVLHDVAGQANAVTLSVSGDQLIVHDSAAFFKAGVGTRSADGHSVSIPLASITGAITIHGGAGDDTLTVDLNGGDPIPAGGLIYHGGGQTTAKPGDSLVIQGGSQGVVTYNYTNANDGSVEMSAFGVITYTGLEPVANSGSAEALIFNLPNTDDQIALSAVGSSLLLDSLNGTFEDTTFGLTNVTSVTINTGDGADTFSLNGVTAGFTPALAIDMGAGADAFSIGAATTLSGAFTLTTESVTQTAALMVTGATQILAEAAGTTSVALTNAANNFSSIAIASGSSVSITDTDALVVAGANVTTLLTLSSGGTITQTGLLSGTGGLTKNGTSTLVLSQANTYSGVTTINAGTVNLTHAQGLGSTAAGTVVNGSNGATATVLALAPTAAITVAEPLTLNANATGRANLNNNGQANVWSGPITVNSTTAGNHVQFNSNGAAGSSLMVSGDISGSLASGTSLLIRGGQAGTISGNINLSGNLGKTDGNTWTVGAAGKTYAWGTTTVSLGTLILGAANVLPATTQITIGQDGNTATLNLQGFSQTVAGISTVAGGTRIITGAAGATLTVNNAAASTFSGELTGALALVKQGAGTLSLTGANANTFTGGVTVNAGVLQLAKTDNIISLPSNVNIVGGTLRVDTVGQFLASTNGTGTNITVNGGTFDLRGGGYRGMATSLNFVSGTITDGDGTVDSQINLVWDNPAAVRIRGGLTIPIALAIDGSNLANGITFDAANNGTATISGAVILANANKTITVNNGTAADDLVISGPIHRFPSTSALGFTKLGAGTLVVSGNNTYDGLTAIAAGTLVARSATALGTAAGATVVSNGTTLQIDGAHSIAESIMLAGTGVGGIGALNHINGAATVTGDIQLAGNATINTESGSLNVAGNVLAGAGSLTVTGAGSTTISGAVLAANAYSSAVLADSPINYWRLLETSGTSTTDATGHNSGTLAGSYTLNQPGPIATDPASRSIDFSGGTMQAPLFTGVQAKFSVEFWLNADALADYNQGIGQGWGWWSFHSAANGAVYTGNNCCGGGNRFEPNLLPAGTVQVGQWSHFVYTFDNSLTANNAKFYKNGTLIAQTQLTTGANPLTNSAIGTVNGRIAELAVYDKALSANQVLNHFAAASGTENLIKTGSGTLTLAGANTYRGTTTVNGGTLLVNGTLVDGAAATDVVVNGAVLGGTGTISGAVSVTNGTVAPGTSPGVLSTGSVTYSGANTFAAEVEGDDAGLGAGFHDQLVVTGTVALGGGTTTLSLTGGYVPTVGDDFVLIANDGSDATTGFFAGLPEAAQVNFNGRPLYITYQGGDGNDVALTTSLTYPGTAGADAFVLTGDGTIFTLTVNGGAPLNYTNLADITINGGGGDDSLTVDFSAGGAIPAGGIVFNGNGQDGSGAPAGIGDWLRVVGTGTQATTYLPNGSVNAALDHDGVLTVDGRNITFTGLEPMDVENVASAAVNLPGGADLLTVQGGLTFGTAQPAIRVSGSSGGVPIETVAYRNVGTITINTVTGGSDGTDTITANAISAGHGNSNLTIDTGAGADAININSVVNFDAASAALSLTSGGNIAFASGAELVTPAATGSVSLTAAGQVTDADAGNDVTASSLSITAAGASPAISLDFTVAQLTTNSAGGNSNQDLNQLTGTASILGLNAGTGVVTLTGAFATSAANVLNDATALVVNTALSLGGNETIGSLAGSGSVALGSNTLTLGGSNASTTFSGRFTGGIGGVTKEGTGTFTQTGGAGNNTYTGTTTVNGGVFEIGAGFGSDGAIQGNVQINNGGTLRLLQSNIIANGADINIASGGLLNMNTFGDTVGSIAGAGNITNNNGITLDDLAANPVFSGNITGGGALNLRSAISTGTQTISGGTHTLGNIGVGRGTLSLTNSPTITGNTVVVGDNFVAGAASGAISATLNIDSGSLAVSQIDLGNNNTAGVTVQGTFNQSGGTVSTSNGAPPDGASLRIGHWPTGTGFYNLSGGTLTVSQNLSTAIDGTGTFTQTGGTASASGVKVNARTGGSGNGTFIVRSGTFNVGTAGIVNEGTGPGAVTIGDAANTLAGGVIRATGSFSSSLNITLAGTGASTASFDTNGNTITLSGVVSGTGLNKTGAGTLILSGGAANTYTGVTNVQAGTLRAAKNSALGTTAGNTVVAAGAVLDLASVSYTAAEPVTLAGATLQTSTGSSSFAGPLTITGASAVDVLTGASLSLTAAISGAGQRLTKVGPGTLTINTASGTTSLNQLDAAGGNLVLAGASVINVSSTTRVGVSPGSVGAPITGTQPGSGTLTIQDSVALTSGAILMGENAATIVSGMTAVINQTGGSVTTTGNSGESAAIRIGHWGNETSTYNLSGGTLTHQGANDLTIATDGNGVFNQTGGQVFAAGVVVNHRNTNGNASFAVSGGTFNLGSRGITTAGGPASVSLGGAGAILRATADWSSSLPMTLLGSGANAISIDTNGFNVTLGGSLSGAGGSLIKAGAGTLVLAAANTYSGATTVAGGRLLVNGSLANGASDPDVIVGSGATLGGTGSIAGSVLVSTGGTLAPGLSPGILATGDVEFTPASTFNVEINSLVPGTGHDQLQVTGTVELGGATLAVSGTLVGTVLGNTVVLIANDGVDPVVGTFAGLGQGAALILNGETFRIFYNGGSGNDVVLVRAGNGVGGNVDVAYVNEDWSSVVPGTDPDGVGPAVAYLVDSYANIQAGIENLNPSAVLYVLGSDSPYAGFTLDEVVEVRFIADYQDPAETNVTIDGAVSLAVDADWVLFDGTVAGTAVDPASLSTTATGTIDGATANTRTLSLVSTTDGTGAVSLAGTIGASGPLLTATIGTVAESVGSLLLGDLRASSLVQLNVAGSVAATSADAAAEVTAAELRVVAGTSVDLGTAVNNLTLTAGTTATVAELDALVVDGLQSPSLQLTAGGSLSDSVGAVIAVSGNATLTAAGVVLGDDAGDSTNFGSVTVVSSAGVAISEDSSLDLAGASSGVGSVVLSSTDGSFALPAGASLSVSGAGSDITLNAADDVVIGGSIMAVDRLSINLDGGVADVGGSSLSIAATSVITTGGGVTGGTVITGGAEADLFSFRPQTTTAFVVDGGAPVLPVTPGDVLDLDLSGFAAGSTILTLGPTAGSGSYSFAAPQNEQSVSYTSIETVDADITGGYHLVLDLGFSGLENGAADTVDARLSTGGGANLELSVNSLPFFSGVAASIRSLTVIGSDDADTFTLTEVEGQLPSFVAAAPPVDNTAIGGGASLGAHQNATSTAVLGAQAVTIHFAGGAGSNTVGLVLTSTDDATYFADTVGADQSGNLAVPADTLVSFAGAASLNLTGAGGSLTVDASSTPAVSTITLASPAAGQTSISGNVDLATSLAQGFAGLSVLGGDGAETIEVLAVGAGLTSLTLSGNNRAGTDAAADTLRVHTLPAGITTASLLGGAGSDTFQLYSSTSTVDGILSPVTVNGSDGNVGGNTDTLVVIDSGDADGDVVSITQNSLEGLTGYSGTPDVSYSNIDVLTVTATAGADTITTSLAAGSDLNIVTVNGNDSADQFYLSLPDPGAGPGSGIATVNLNGDAGNDSFGDATTRIQPSRTTAVNINGGAPTPGGLPTGNTVGDHLSLDLSAIPTTSAVIVTTVPGQVNASGYAGFSFADIEDLDLYDSTGLTTIEMGDLYARGTEQADSFVFTNGWLPEQPSLMRVMINSFGGYLTIPGKIVVYARGGNDYLTQHDTPRIAHFYGEGGNDYLAGALQADLLVGGLNDDQLLGSSGNDTIWGDEGPTPANPAPQDDVAGGFDRINGGLGNDIIYAGGGNDQAFGNGDDDYLHGGQGDDTLDGGEGNDRVYGSAGNDQLSGYFGYDLLSGGEGNDVLTGNSGNDVLIGGLGSDSLVGNDDSDLMVTGTTVPVGAGATSANSTAAGDANDQALLALLLAWGTTGTDRTLLGTVTQDGVYDEVFSGNGNDEITRDNPLDRLFDFTVGQDEEF